MATWTETCKNGTKQIIKSKYSGIVTDATSNLNSKSKNKIATSMAKGFSQKHHHVHIITYEQTFDNYTLNNRDLNMANRSKHQTMHRQKVLKIFTCTSSLSLYL